MHPSTAPTPSSRALKAWRTAVPMIVTGCLVASGVVVVGAMGAAAAPGDTITIGADAIALTQPTDPGMGQLLPTSDAAQNGMFGPQVDWPIVPIHAAVARTGGLITFGTPRGQADQSGLLFDDWSPDGGFGDSSHVATATMHSYDSFCNALVGLDDGRMLMVGGNSAMSTMVYDPFTHAQDMGEDLQQQRWYATTLRLPDGRILVLGGGNSYKLPTPTTSEESARVAITPEIGTGSGPWARLTGASSSALFGLSDSHWWYPRAFNGIGGSVIGTSGDAIWTLDPTGAGSVQQIGTLPFDPRTSGSQVMYAPGKILIAGGGQYSNGDDVVGTSAAAILSFDASGATVRDTSPMSFGRNWGNLTVLPTGDVLANGGTRVGTEDGDANSVRLAEIWNPSSETWVAAASAQRTRTYHSTSVLMPSGAVFTGGGGVPGPETNFNAEMYYPPYLFTKSPTGTVSWASRPTITSIAGSATHGGTITLTTADDRPLQDAALISLPTVTHSQNTDQRRIPLSVSRDGDTVRTTLPSSVDTLPPGDYELTVTDERGVPSPAQILTIRAAGAGAVTVSGQVAAGQETPVAAPPAAGPDTSPSTPPAPGSGSAPAPAPAPVATAPSTGSDAVHLTRGATIGIDPVGSSGLRVSHSKSTVSVKKVGLRSSVSARRASSWIVRAGLGSRDGYSFESVDRPGWYLTAAKAESGRVALAKRSKSSSFTSRATFSAVRGVMGHDVSLRLAVKPDRVVCTSGTKLITGSVGRSPARLMAATFTLPKGLASRR